MLRMTSKRNVETDEELCVCFIDCQKAFYCVNWSKLINILKLIGMDLHE